MRIVKKIHYKSPVADFVSHEFDKIVIRSVLPSIDLLELHIGHGQTSIEENKACLCVEVEKPLFQDMRATDTAIKFEIFRLFVKRALDKEIPGAMEDILVAREMIRKNLGDDVAYMLHLSVIDQVVIDVESYIKLNLPWIIFYGHDEFHSNFFRKLSQNIKYPEYKSITEKLFDCMKKDLTKNSSLEKCTGLYEEALYAGNKV
jgi:hypothetical protein